MSEAMRILYSKDQLLNSKNEYLSNNIARVTVDQDKFERKKNELEEERKLLAEKEMFEDFKMKKRVPKKRGRASHEEALTAEPECKKIRKDSNWFERDEQWEAMDLGNWLEKAEARCNRYGLLRIRMQVEREEVLRKMENMRNESLQDVGEDVLDGWRASIKVVSGGTGDHTATVENVISAGEILSKGWKNPKDKNQNKNKEYNLVGLLGWWRRIEKLEEKFWNDSAMKKQEENIKRMHFQSKINFVRKMSGSVRKTEPNESGKPDEVDKPTRGYLEPKRKLFPVEELAGSPNKIRKTNASFTSTWRFWVGKERCTEQQQDFAVLSTGGAKSSDEQHHN